MSRLAATAAMEARDGMAGGRDVETGSVYKVSRGREREQGETERRRIVLNSGLIQGKRVDVEEGEGVVGVAEQSLVTATSDLLWQR